MGELDDLRKFKEEIDNVQVCAAIMPLDCGSGHLQ
jgi:hypothetical protein